jgi:hypothetical protein
MRGGKLSDVEEFRMVLTALRMPTGLQVVPCAGAIGLLIRLGVVQKRPFKGTVTGEDSAEYCLSREPPIHIRGLAFSL